MPIQFHPKPGTILLCDFSTGFMPPEMVKRRPVLVVSPTITGRPFLCTVVCLSTTTPTPQLPFHMKIRLPEPLPPNLSNENVWVKGDMIYAVSFKRLDFATTGKDRTGKRIRYNKPISDEVLNDVRKRVSYGIGLES